VECELLCACLLSDVDQFYVEIIGFGRNPPYCEWTVWVTELFEVFGLLTKDEAMSMKLAVLELDLQITERLVVEVPTRL
jgi:hypothetical protein